MEKRVFWILTLILGLLLVSGAAWADKPVKDELMFTGVADYRWVTCDDQYRPEQDCSTTPESGCDLFFGHAPIDCGDGILVCELSYGHITSKTFLDKEGNTTRYREKGTFGGFLYEYKNFDNHLEYGPIHGGMFLIDYGDVDDPNDDTYSYTGGSFRIEVPGYGLMVQAGRLMFASDWTTTIKEAGQHPLFNGEFGPICDYLAAYHD